MVTLGADGVIYVRHVQGSELITDDVSATLVASGEVAAGIARPCLVDLRGVRSADRGARQAAAAFEMKTIASRAAMLVGGPVTRVIATFFLRVASPPYPTRIFDDEAEALAWLVEALER